MVSGSSTTLSWPGVQETEDEICAQVACAPAESKTGPTSLPKALPGVVGRRAPPPALPIAARHADAPPAPEREKAGEEAKPEAAESARWPLEGCRCDKLVRGRGAFEADYELSDHELGRGLSGVVWEAYCRRTGKAVAVKAFNTRNMASRALENLRREVEIHGAMEHPGIVRVEAVYESEEEVHIIMDQLAGGEVFSRIADIGRFPEVEAARLLARLLGVVAHLHSKQVMHRDIKPENLLYDSTDFENFQLIDFGFAARFAGGGALRTERCGTLQYVAPEIIRGCGYDEKVDLWSVGCVAYVLLTGKSVYSGRDQQVLRKTAAGEVDFCKRFRDLSEGAQEFVLSLLQRDPKQRPSAQEALRHPWLQYLAQEVLLADSTWPATPAKDSPATTWHSPASCAEDTTSVSRQAEESTAIDNSILEERKLGPAAPSLQHAAGKPRSELAKARSRGELASVAMEGFKEVQDATLKVLASRLTDVLTLSLRDLAVICK